MGALAGRGATVLLGVESSEWIIGSTAIPCLRFNQSAMRAVVTRPGEGRAWLADIPEPAIQHVDDVLVKILRVGVCGTARHVMEGGGSRARPLPDDAVYLVIGHEAVGRVIGISANVRSLRVGDAVVPTVRRGSEM